MAVKRNKAILKTGSQTQRAKGSATEVGAPPKVAPSEAPDQLFAMGEAIALLKTTRATFYRWLREGKIRGMKTGRQWRFERGEIDRFLKGEEPRIELRTDIAPFIEALEKRAAEVGAKEASLPLATPVQRAVSLMIRIGLAMRASDIHIAPNLDNGKARRAVVRCRVDGVLHQDAQFDIRLLPPLVEQWKLLAACNPKERQRPQDGLLKMEYGDESVTIRISFLPSVLGETLTARLLPQHVSLVTLDQIDYAPRDREKLLRWIKAPNGVVISSGPVGCGKTTALLASLKLITNPEIKVMTAEDPVEFIFPWMVQTQINEREGVTYSSAMRAILRSDPDVIMIGELRDGEIVQFALSAALTGHLVLSQMHTDEAANALVRLVQMGAEPFLVSDAVKLVLCQRLARLVCQHCGVKAKVDAEMLAKAERVARDGGLDWDFLPKDFRKAVGCDKCRGTGYNRRNVIAETMEMSPEIGAALRRGAAADELRAIAVRQGMTTMSADGIRRAAEGKTTLDEVFRSLALR